ncbi:30S ribosomal protein S20 [bacterium]|nr:30S ribosomal protein S20 [bacterium]
MGRHSSAIKRNRQNEKRNARNKQNVTFMRTMVKKVRIAVASQDKAAAKKTLVEAIKVIDKTATKGIIPAERASRYNSRLTRSVNKMA